MHANPCYAVLVTSTHWPIAISTADDSITAGVCLWRQRQQLFATVAVKSTFTLVPGGTMTLRAPLPIERAERSMPQTIGIEPGDLAPCLVQPEVWVRGHAWYPPAEGAPSVRARLVVARDGIALLRKTLEVPVQYDPFVPPYLHAFAPLSRTWPVRTRLLGAFDWTNLDRSPIELPDVFDWSYFHATPTDQHLGPLRGDEWIRLESMHPTMLKFDTQLPSASCAVMMFGNVEPFRQGVPLRVGLDSIQIDVDHGVCSLVFRGHTPLPTNIAWENLQFVAGLGLPGRPVPQLEPRTATSYKSAPPPPSHPPGAAPSIKETLLLDESLLRTVTEREVLPFHERSPGDPAPNVSTPRVQQEQEKRSSHSVEKTFFLDESLQHALGAREALPFHESSSGPRSPSPNLSPTEERPISPASSLDLDAPLATARNFPLSSIPPAQDVTSTLMMTDEMLAQLEGSAPTPFAGGEPLPERDEKLDVLSALPFQPAMAIEGVAPPHATTKNLTLGAFFLAAMDDARQAEQPTGRGAAC